MSKPIEVNEADFDQKVMQSDKLVVVDFWAPWCGPCRMVAPILEELAGELGERAIIAKINTDNNQGVASRFGIRGIPTMIFFRNGQEVDRVVGALPKPALQQRIEALAGTGVA